MYSITKSSFLWYLVREIKRQTKEPSLIFISVLFVSVTFGSARLHWNQTKIALNGIVPSEEPRARIAGPNGTVLTVLM